MAMATTKIMLAFITPAAKIEASKCSCPVTFRDIPLSHQFLPFFASQMLPLKNGQQKNNEKNPHLCPPFQYSISQSSRAQEL